MLKLLKFLIGLVLLLLVVIIVAPMVIDPNDYREQIETVVEEKTGRELTIDGDLSLSVFPWLGVGINDVSLSNAVGFKAEKFAQIKRANVKVKLLPLLSKQVEVSAIVLQGMRLNLEKNASGITNWQDLSQASSKDEPSESSEGSGTSEAGVAALAVGGLKIEDANVNWDDASKGERYSITNLDLKTGALSLGGPMPVDLAFTVESNKPKTTVRLKLNGDLVINADLNKFDFQNMVFIVDAAGDPIPRGAMKIDIASHLIVDLAGQGSLLLNPLSIRFDETTITGQAAVNNLAKPAVKFALAVDTLNVDRYLSEPDEGAKADPSSSKVTLTPPPAAAALLPVDTIRGLDIDGKISIQSLFVNGLTAGDASLTVKAKNGVLTTTQAVKQFYNGGYAGSTVIDVRSGVPQVKVAEQAKNINIEGMLADMLGEASVSGVANLKVNLMTHGNTIPAFKSALNGTTEFSVKDGAIKGLDAEALIKQAQQVVKGNLGALAQKGGGETPFSELSGTATITNGLVRNSDLLAASPVLNLQGKGTVDLIREKIDYRMFIKRTKALEADEASDKNDLKNMTIPINITGTFSKPSISLDVQAMVMEFQREKIDEKATELKEKLNKKLDKSSSADEEEGDKKINAGDLLKGLF
ncbi:MAG: AsmA family protein [Cycloclasticus sp. symbiont of Poecilosclerida sp. M]|nr:MAG: AsmA family protein [Cycloclasticus sp. symbiont of Poecilosclerida sp. M]